MEGSGGWVDRDVLIGQGRSSPTGRESERETGQPMLEVDRPGAMVRPGIQTAAEAEASYVRSSTTSGRVRTAILSAGSPADLLVYATDAARAGQVEIEIRGGRIAGLNDSCFAG